MSEIGPEELARIETDYHVLIASQQTLLLSTVSEEGLPQISYAPCVRDQVGIFYIYISTLARHTASLLKNQQASIMFIRPESESNNLFARERVVFDCSAREVERDIDIYQIQLQALQEKFGEVVEILRSLPDFHLFALKPESGRYVVGFGRAFTINVSNGQLNPITSDQKRES